MSKVFSFSASCSLLLLLLWSSCEKDNLQTLTTPEPCDTCHIVVCDTSFILSYKNDIQPITATYCDKCHSPLNAPIYGDGNTIGIYSGISVFAADGTLLCAIKHEADCVPMPDDDPKLSDCNIARIEAWVRQGYPDN